MRLLGLFWIGHCGVSVSSAFPAENVSETDSKPSDSTPDSQSPAKIGSVMTFRTSASTDKVAREVPPKDQPPVVIVNPTGFPVTPSRQDESAHPENPLLTETSRLRNGPDNKSDIIEIRERRTAQDSCEHRSPYDLPDSMHRRAFRINDGTVEERSIASVTFLWGRTLILRR